MFSVIKNVCFPTQVMENMTFLQYYADVVSAVMCEIKDKSFCLQVNVHSEVII